MQGWTWEEDSKADPLTEKDEETVEHRSNGRREPDKSQPHCMFYVLSQWFGVRGCQEHH